MGNPFRKGGAIRRDRMEIVSVNVRRVYEQKALPTVYGLGRDAGRGTGAIRLSRALTIVLSNLRIEKSTSVIE
jgi:hypothetical protein